MSRALIFVDLKAAFYSVVREFLLSRPPTELDVVDLCGMLGHSEEQTAELLSLLSRGGDDMVQDVPHHLRAYLEDLLTCTWFQVRGAEYPVHTRKGTRPGDPLADLLFSMCTASPLQQLAREMQTASACLDLSCGGVLPGVGVGACYAPATASWHDDVVAFVAVPQADQLLDMCAFVARRIHDLFALRGLLLNYEHGKSEAVCTPVGPGLKPVLHKLRHPQGCSLYFLPDNGGMQSLACVDAYRHLGSMLHDTGSLLVDIRRRLQQARMALQPLRKPLLGRKDLSQQAKHNFFRSYVISRLLHNVGAWSGMLIQEQHAWQSGILGLYKAMRPRPVVQPDEHLSSVELCQFALCPAPLVLVRIERLRLAGQLARQVDVALLSVLDAAVGNSACWLTALMEDIVWARSRVPDTAFHGLPFDADVGQVFSWLNSCHGKWPARLQLLWDHAANHPLQEDFMQRQDLDKVAKCCPLCQCTLKGRQGLAAHLARKHNLHLYTHRLIRGTRCGACGLELHTRTRLICHVQKRSPNCKRYLIRHCRPLSKAECQVLDNEERLRKKATKEAGRLDRAPAVQMPIPALDLADSGSESDSPTRHHYDLLLKS